jgi:hypothetical protein
VLTKIKKPPQPVPKPPKQTFEQSDKYLYQTTVLHPDKVKKHFTYLAFPHFACIFR